MKRIFFFFLIAAFLHTCLIGQQLQSLSIEELEYIVDTIENNSHLDVDVNNELAFKLKNTELEKSKFYAGKANSLADSIGYDLGKSFSLVNLGLISKREKNISLAETFFLEALILRQKVASNKDVASVYNNLGMLFEQNNSSKSKNYYELGLLLLNETPPPSFKAVIHNNYGSFLIKENQFEAALVQLESALKIRREIGDPISMANSFLNLSGFYFEVNDTSQFKIFIDSAQFYFEKTNDKIGLAKSHNLRGKFYEYIKDYDQAEKHFKLAISLVEIGTKDSFVYLRNLGVIAIHREDYERALKTFEECLIYFTEINDQREIASILINIGTIYYEQSNYQEAISYYEKSLSTIKNINDILLEAKALIYLSASYGYLGENEKSADLGVKYLLLSDNYNQQKSQSLNTLLDEKDSLVKKAKLKAKEVSSSLQFEKEKSKKIRMYTILIVAIIFFLFLSATFLAYLYRQKKRIAEYKIDEILSKNERNANYARLEEQESERNRIARDLHDRLGGMFTAIKFSMGDVEATLSDIKEENKVHYDKVNNLIDLACDEVRNIAHDLMNSTLANFGLKIALESLVGSLTKSNIQIELLSHGLEDHRMSNKIEINIYLIIQELISNALKHSNAKKMTIQLNRFEDRLNISVEDDGIGFDTEKVKMGIGILNIETRVHGLEGKLNIDSSKGNGTTVMIDIPLNIIN